MKQQYPSIDDLIAQERNSIGGVDRWTSAGYGLVVGERTDPVTFEQAVQTAKAICPNVNMYAEYTDAYVFSQKEDLSFGGNSPLVILKSCGGSMSIAKQDNYKKERTETALSFHFSDFGMRGYISMVKPSGLFLRFSFSF